jgi:pimeloyl-ACP methyl ester carboxylesterase
MGIAMKSSASPTRRHMAILDNATMSWLEAGKGDALVLLHGIGSAACSWQAQLDALSANYRVIAWDAPGYGRSDGLGIHAPDASDYAARLQRLLRHLGISKPLLVGHSLGALMLGAYLRNARAKAAVFAAPALGYGGAEASVREEKRQSRINMFESLGPERMAEERSANLLSSKASPEALESVRRVMAGVRAEGYLPATELLANGDLLADVGDLTLPCLVLCGEEDTVTPPANARRLAAAIPGAQYADIPAAGHACYVERPRKFNSLLESFLASVSAAV